MKEIISEKCKRTIQGLVEDGDLSKSGRFDITDDLISKYCLKYREINKGKYKPKSSDEKFHRKMAGVILLTELNNRLEDSKIIISRRNSVSKDTKSGFVYVISNPAFEGYYKIGMTHDLNGRLNSYQTCDPLRRYKIERSEFVLDRRKAEKKIFNKISVDLKNGEWVNSKKIADIFHLLVNDETYKLK